MLFTPDESIHIVAFIQSAATAMDSVAIATMQPAAA